MRGRVLFAGRGGSGPVVHSDVGLSFWGGVDPKTGVVIDARHPLAGRSVRGAVLCLPGGRGSCTGSQVVLELLLNGAAPAALVLRRRDDIMALGAFIAKEFFDVDDMVIVHLDDDDAFARLAAVETASVRGDGAVETDGSLVVEAVVEEAAVPLVALSPEDEAMLASPNKALAAAMRVVAAVAALQGARDLVTVDRAHIDAVTFIGPGGLRFAERLVAWGGRVRCPTTTNAMSCDRRRWRELRVPAALARDACALADAYVALGCEPTFTCAPYLIKGAEPALSQHLGWSESNAVAYANSKCGARTQKYADYMDACIALTGRAPNAGAHLDAERAPTVRVDCSALATTATTAEDADVVFYATLGYAVGAVSTPHIPIVTGLVAVPSIADEALKAFAAAFATTSAASMFHIAGHTPEAAKVDDAAVGVRVRVSLEDLGRTWRDLAGAEAGFVDLVALGSPHASLGELKALAAAVEVEEGTFGSGGLAAVVVTTSAATLDEAEAAGVAARLRARGVDVVTDTCWCMIAEPTIDPAVRAIATTSAKYAHYAPGLVNKPARLSSLEGCLAAARTRRFDPAQRPFQPHWAPPRRALSTTASSLRAPFFHGRGVFFFFSSFFSSSSFDPRQRRLLLQRTVLSNLRRR